jgi:hypothetical protein
MSISYEEYQKQEWDDNIRMKNSDKDQTEDLILDILPWAIVFIFGTASVFFYYNQG